MTDADPNAYSAFISHASVDAKTAEAIAAELETKGLRCWIAPRDVRPGAEYASEVILGIERSKCFVLLLSEASNLSAHVRREVERAASKGKPIYPVRIEDVPPSPKLEYFISMHHWIDAWDGQLSKHVERLVGALESSEEWIGNKIQRRRRHMSLGGIAVLSVMALIAALVFAGDLRQMFQSDSERARRDLAAGGVAMDGPGIADALVAADKARLGLMRRAGLGVVQLAEALRMTRDGGKKSVAELFFENGRNSPETVDWLRQMLAGGLDPNLLVPHWYFEREGMLNSALRVGNAEASIAILEAGASPHPYQNLWFVEVPTPRFMFPNHVLAQSDQLNAEKKLKLAAAFQKAGAVNLSLKKAGYRSASETEPEEPGAEKNLCKTIGTTPICEAAKKRTGTDWCAIAANLPKQMTGRPKESYAYQMARLELNALINVIDNKGYFIASETSGPRVDYVLMEISEDGKLGHIFKYIEAIGGKGFCKKDDNSNLVPRYCWRRFDLAYDEPNKIMLVDNYYKYDVSMNCRE